MNKVILMGRMARDPEVRYTQSNEPLAVANFAVAVDRPFSSNRDASQPSVDFINCVCFGKRGENIGKFFRKGNRIALTGRIQVRDWQDQSGQKRYATEVIVDDFEFCESKSAASASAEPSAPNTPQSSRSGYQGARPDSFYDIASSADDEDLPF